MEPGRSLEDLGINAVWLGSGSLTAERVSWLREQGARVFAEFNTLHVASYVREHPDSAPVGSDGDVCPPPQGWQGVCPTHPGYRAFRMEAFRRTLQNFDIDGIWLDYHHSHASWERAEPEMPDTCFCRRCLAQFAAQTGLEWPDAPISEIAERIRRRHAEAWIQWRCGVFTDWVREFRAILNETKPGALLGTFHCPWSESDYDGALRNKLAIDLKAQAEFLDVFSPMPYHARFGHADDPAWISRQTEWLAKHLGVRGEPGDRLKIWPIIQLADWEEPVPASQVEAVVDHGTRKPATGVMIFHWSGIRSHEAKRDALTATYRLIRPTASPVGPEPQP